MTLLMLQGCVVVQSDDAISIDIARILFGDPRSGSTTVYPWVMDGFPPVELPDQFEVLASALLPVAGE